MEDQLQLMDQMDVRFRIGDEIQGEILKIGSSEVFVSLIGYKTDGIIPFSELTYSDNLEETLGNLKQGDSIKAKVIKLRNEDNYV
ncbi:S1 RNA-binding domain-containing protein, partial [Clostridium saudiense]|nr:S1 RNA-binding domain-containing protein [Clostridium saudiense]